jgi:hypothetical protein
LKALQSKEKAGDDYYDFEDKKEEVKKKAVPIGIPSFKSFTKILDNNRSDLIPLEDTHYTKLERLKNKLKHNNQQMDLYDSIMGQLTVKRKREFKECSKLDNIQAKSKEISGVRIIPNLERIK